MIRKLRTQGLVKRYGKKTVVNNVSIEVNEGEIVGLLGPNGAGKTTTFYMTIGIIKPTEGDVYLGEMNITHLPMFKRARMGLSYLSQEPSIFRKLTVEQNIKAILETVNIPRKEKKEKLEILLNELGLNQLRKSKAYTLSGGERRKVEITRALVTNPQFMLLDEPFVGVDPIAVEEIQSIIFELKKKRIGVLITDHNVHETLSVTDRAYLLYEGVVLKSGDTNYLANDKETRKLYLGEKFKLDR